MKLFQKRGAMIAGFSFILLLSVPVILTLGGILLNNPGLFSPPGPLKRLSIYLTTNIAETSDEPVFPELKTPAFSRPASELFEDVKTALGRLGWEASEVNPDEMTIHAVITTALWHFQDDVTIRVTESSRGSSLYVRSSSRVGKGDLGANRAHILHLIELLERG